MPSTIADDLVGAVGRGELLVHYQPIVTITDQRIVAVEALARWNHPTLGMISPNDFIPVAEETGIISEIGRFMISTACKQAVIWRDFDPGIEVSINVSATELSSPNFCSDVLGMLAESGIDPAVVTLEVTESLPIGDIDGLLECLAPVRVEGLRLSIDDYGSGYASLHRMYRLMASELKIDRKFFIDGDWSDLTSVVNRAHDSGARVVAEGVETLEHLDRAARLGADRLQGYLLGRPMPADELSAMLQRD
ncbi:MAG TPA: EAL domain-containing protein [Rhodoglobus sp.]|nr:EAL domain-containing protein [Rhodoglobus sp.]